MSKLTDALIKYKLRYPKTTAHDILVFIRGWSACEIANDPDLDLQDHFFALIDTLPDDLKQD